MNNISEVLEITIIQAGKNYIYTYIYIGLPRWLSSKKSSCQHRRLKTQILSLAQEDLWE